MSLPIDEQQELIIYAFPGGYQISFLDKENCILCGTCAQEAYKDKDNEHLAPTSYFTHWEGCPITCEECYKKIESEYGCLDKCDCKKEG